MIGKRHKDFDLLIAFSLCAAIFGLAQFFYATAIPHDMNFGLLALALLLLLFPDRPVFLAAYAGLSIIDYFLRAPLFSNHMMLALVLWMYVAGAWMWGAVREKSWDVEPLAFYNRFAPAGRLLLLTMYFFGVFHKINSAFLNPETSCASALINSFIFLPPDMEFPAFIYNVASYGTLATEALIGLLLLFPRTRYFGVVAGILFHLLITFSAFRYYVPFSMLSICLHSLFLDPGALERLRSGKLAKFLRLGSSVTGRVVIAAPILFMLTVFACIFNYGDLNHGLVLWGIAGLIISIIILVYDRPVVPPAPEKNYFITQFVPFNLIAMSFFLTCFSPYFGFKTAQTINMFSNLETEQGRSNHYLIPKPWYFWQYQNDLVYVLKSDDPSLEFFQKPVAMVGYQFETYLLDHPEAHVTYERGGEIKETRGLPDGPDTFSRNWFLRKFMVFNSVNTTTPRPCFDASDAFRASLKPAKDPSETE